jgi:hypothetical protein
MQEQAPAVTAPTSNPAPVQSQPSTPSVSSESASTPRTYSEAEYNSKVSELNEYQRQIQNATQFIETDPEVKQRLDLYARSFKDNKPYQDLVKEWESSRNAKNAPKETPTQGMTPEQIQQIIDKRLEASTRPFVETQAKQIQKESQEAILKSNPWATEKDWDVFSQRFDNMVNQKAAKIAQDNYPRMSQKEAFDRAVSSFVDVDDNILWDSLMKSEREEAILGKRRATPKLPDGMVDNVRTGKDPDLMDKLKRAYQSIEGDGEKVASLLKEYAPQFGIDANNYSEIKKLHSAISK